MLAWIISVSSWFAHFMGHVETGATHGVVKGGEGCFFGLQMTGTSHTEVL